MSTLMEMLSYSTAPLYLDKNSLPFNTLSEEYMRISLAELSWCVVIGEIPEFDTP